MLVPVLLIVVGTRAELIAAASLIAALRAAPRYSLPFELRLIVTGQERTELDQTIDALGMEPDADLSIKTPHLADASLSARLLEEMEGVLRHHDPKAVIAVGSSASAWATAIATYFKQIPLAHLGAGFLPLASERPFPDYLHNQELARLASLHLCFSADGAESLRRETSVSLNGEGPTIRVVGDGGRETFAWALQNSPEAEDPTLEGLRPEAPRVLVFVRRREHHANALRPLCESLNSLAGQYPDHEFIVVYSQQAFICDAFVSLLSPERTNLHGVSPLPYPAFAREIARARLVVTDSVGVAREAAQLGRPLVAIGAYSLQQDVVSAAIAGLVVAEMNEESIESALKESLAAPAPGVAPKVIDADRAGEAAAGAIVEWVGSWK